jgi:repressor LexA
MDISNNEQRVYSFISEYSHNFGYSPTLQEIQKKLGFKSLTSIQRAIMSLEEKKYIKRDKHKQRGITLINQATKIVSIPLVGTVACGTPILANENIEGYIATDSDFIKDGPEKYFYLRARGDSMDKAGIDNDDLVLIHRQNQAKDGDMIVALLDDSATIKTLKRRNGYIILEPKSYSTSHSPIILKEDFLIQGVVAKVVKS